MKLMTKAIEKKFEKFPLYSQDSKGEDAEVVVKFFTPDAQATWLITEGEPLEEGEWRFYGYCTVGYEWEWGYVLLSQLKKIRGGFGLPVERDLYIDNHAKVRDLI